MADDPLTDLYSDGDQKKLELDPIGGGLLGLIALGCAAGCYFNEGDDSGALFAGAVMVAGGLVLIAQECEKSVPPGRIARLLHGIINVIAKTLKWAVGAGIGIWIVTSFSGIQISHTQIIIFLLVIVIFQLADRK
jgi:hypothetical protein